MQLEYKTMYYDESKTNSITEFKKIYVILNGNKPKLLIIQYSYKNIIISILLYFE